MKYCGFDGCQVKIERGTYCKEHAPRRKAKAKKSAYHHENKSFYRTQAWRDVSDFVYERETITALETANTDQDKRLKNVEEYQTMAEIRSQKIVKAEKASLHNQIWNKADEYIKRGYITVGELNNFDYLFEAYKNLGGNGTGDTLRAKVSDLSVRDEGILQQKEIDEH